MKIKLSEPRERADLRRQCVEVIPTAIKLDDPALAISFDASGVRNGSKSYIIHHAKISVALIQFEMLAGNGFQEDCRFFV
jgi:hypothetical protein